MGRKKAEAELGRVKNDIAAADSQMAELGAELANVGKVDTDVEYDEFTSQADAIGKRRREIRDRIDDLPYPIYSSLLSWGIAGQAGPRGSKSTARMLMSRVWQSVAAGLLNSMKMATHLTVKKGTPKRATLDQLHRQVTG